MRRLEIRRALRRHGGALDGLAHPADRLRRFFSESIWEEQPEARWRRLLYPRLRVLTLVCRNYWRHNLSRHAAALTYSSLLAIVPSLAVAFSLFKAFGGLEEGQVQLERWIYDYLAPSAAQREQIQSLIERAIAAVQSGTQANALLATILLIFTAVNTLSNIESSFNEIFGIQRSRGWVARFTVYWAVGTLGPVLVGASIVMAASLRSTAFIQWFSSHVPFAVDVVYRLTPVLFTIAAFTLLYRFLPYTRVSGRAALAGGVIGGLLFEATKWGFTGTADALLTSYQRVYGAIALLLVFFFWVWLSWMVLLLGLEFVVATQAAATHRREELAATVSPKVREAIALRLFTVIAERFYRGEPPPSATSLAQSLNLPIPLIHGIMEVLEDRGVVRTIAGPDEEFGFLPGRHLGNLTPYDVVHALRDDDQGSGLAPPEDAEGRALARLVAEADAADRRVYGAETFERLIERLIASRGADGAGAVAREEAEAEADAPPRAKRSGAG